MDRRQAYCWVPRLTTQKALKELKQPLSLLSNKLLKQPFSLQSNKPHTLESIKATTYLAVQQTTHT